MASETAHHVRIGELGRRVGLKPEVLRAWERRYGVLQPSRTEGGLRLYSPTDERRARRMLARMADGLSPAEAARLVLADDDESGASSETAPLEGDIERLRDALDRFDADTANATFDRLLASFTIDTVLGHVVMPYLRDLGERWADGNATVAQEHFASSLLRARLAGLTRGWETGAGPRALLACAPGEQHDLPLLVFGIALRIRGWRIVYLGQDTPAESVVETAAQLAPAIVVVSATTRSRFRGASSHLTALARKGPLVIAGQGASESLAASLGARWVPEGPVAAAEQLTGELAGRVARA